MNFIEDFTKQYGKTPLAALLDIVAAMPTRELTDKNIAGVYALFCATVLQSSVDPEAASEHHENAVFDLIECPPQKLREIIEIARSFADHVDDINSGTGRPEGAVAKQFYLLKNAIERKRAEPEIFTPESEE